MINISLKAFKAKGDQFFSNPFKSQILEVIINQHFFNCVKFLFFTDFKFARIVSLILYQVCYEKIKSYIFIIINIF